MPRRTDPDLLHLLGSRLGALRRERGLTQEQLAEAAGLEPLTLSRVENGSRTLSIANLARVAACLDVGLGELVDVDRPLPRATADPDELAWTRLWHAMSPEQRDTAVRMLREFLRAPRPARRPEVAYPASSEGQETAEIEP